MVRSLLFVQNRVCNINKDAWFAWLNPPNVDSEDSLSDEYTLFVEEVHTEDIPTEASDVPMPKIPLPNSDVLDEETSVSVDNDLGKKVILIKSTSECDEIIENFDPSTIINATQKSNTNDAKISSSKIEEVNGGMVESSSKNGKTGTTFVCNGTIVHRTNEDSEKKSCKKSYSDPSTDKDLNEAAVNTTTLRNYSNKLNSEVVLNGASSSTQASPSPIFKNNFPRFLNEKNNSGNYGSCETGKETCSTAPNSRKRSSEFSEVNGSAAFKNNCDKLNELFSVSDVKKCKLSSSTKEYSSTSGDGASYQCPVPVNSKINNSAPSQRQLSSPNTSTTVAKKNIARKHTSPMNVAKNMKDVESTVLAELTKHEKNLPNGRVQNLDITAKKGFRDQSSNTDPMYKVNLSVDSLSADSVRNIFKTMRKTLTRRQLEEIVLQKVCEMISDSNEIGELKKQILELQAAENHRKSTCFNLEKQIHQLKGVCQVFIEKANNAKKDGRTCIPTMITRSVGLQVSMDVSSSSRLSTSTASSAVVQQTKNSDSKPHISSCGDAGKLAPASTSLSSTNSAAVTSNTESSMAAKSSPSIIKGLSKTPAASVPVQISPIIDLTDKEDKSDDTSEPSNHPTASLTNTPPVTSVKIAAGAGSKPGIPNRTVSRHPAPLPKPIIYPIKPGAPHPPPKPELTISRNNDGISLSWNMPLNQNCAKIASYQIYAYQETNVPLVSDPWKPVGEVNALPLPMECTLTQFFQGYRYHFTVRAVDELKRVGPFSEASSIAL